MPAKSKPGLLADTIAASKANLKALQKLEKYMKGYNPVLHWAVTPITELAKFGPEVWLDVEEAFLKEKKASKNVALPGWDDVIKTGFDTPISPPELAAHKSAVKAGKKSPLSAEQLEGLAKRHERALRIAKSPIPSSVRSIGSILTWYDDIQDSVVALSYAGRLAAKITGRVSSQLAKKWAMPLTYVMTAAEMIDWMRLFRAGDIAGDIARTKRLISVERAIATPETIKRLKALEAIVDSARKRGGAYTVQQLEEIKRLASMDDISKLPLMKELLRDAESSVARRLAGVGLAGARSTRKRQVYAALSSLPYLTNKQFKYLTKLKGILPSFSEAVQIAQTTAQTTGYGLSLGGVVGYASDSVFGTLRGSKREDVPDLPTLKSKLKEVGTEAAEALKPIPMFYKDQLDATVREYHRLFQSPELTPLTMSALNIMNIGPQLMAVAGDLSVEDNLFVLTAVKRAAVYLNNIGALEEWDQWAKPHLDLEIKPPVVSFTNQLTIHEINPDMVQTEYMLPFMDGVKSITPRLKTSLLAPKISAGFEKWLRPLGADMRVNYAMGLIADLASDSFGALEGPDEEMITRLTPAGRSVMVLHEYGLASALGTPPEIEQALYSQLSDWMIRRQGSSPTFQEVSALIDLLQRLY